MKKLYVALTASFVITHVPAQQRRLNCTHIDTAGWALEKNDTLGYGTGSYAGQGAFC